VNFDPYDHPLQDDPYRCTGSCGRSARCTTTPSTTSGCCEALRGIVIFLSHYAGWPTGAALNTLVERTIGAGR